MVGFGDGTLFGGVSIGLIEGPNDGDARVGGSVGYDSVCGKFVRTIGETK